MSLEERVTRIEGTVAKLQKAIRAVVQEFFDRPFDELMKMQIPPLKEEPSEWIV